jgi:TPR repeat protein
MIALLLSVGAAWADDFEDGAAAYQRGEYAMALQIFRTLAAQENADAEYNLGVMYDTGRGITQDYVEAAKWYRLAAAQGDAYAQSNLGEMYANGHGVAQDYVDAVKWFRWRQRRDLRRRNTT